MSSILRMNPDGEEMGITSIISSMSMTSYGHAVGDEVLEAFSDELRKGIRTIDISGRWGGGEFLIFCPETDSGAALELAERLRNMIQGADFGKAGHRTASIGLSTYVTGDDARSLLARADNALYSAKKKGRNQSVRG
jgi:diguanylate cyclase (GGDEF)-like protein